MGTDVRTRPYTTLGMEKDYATHGRLQTLFSYQRRIPEGICTLVSRPIPKAARKTAPRFTAPISNDGGHAATTRQRDGDALVGLPVDWQTGGSGLTRDCFWQYPERSRGSPSCSRTVRHRYRPGYCPVSSVPTHDAP